MQYSLESVFKVHLPENLSECPAPYPKNLPTSWLNLKIALSARLIRNEPIQVIKNSSHSAMIEAKSQSVSLSISYSDDIYSENYVGQFLDISNNDDHHCFSEELNISSRGKKEELMIQAQDIIKEGIIEGHSEEEKLRSSFHNFQKHLVTTLRHSIDLSDVKFDLETKGLESILWNFFLKCQKMTRTLIYLVFGGMNIECQRTKKINRQYGLEKVLKSFPHSTIARAQKNLREQILRQSEKINFDWQLGNRRMKNKEEFRIYFDAFIEELKDGGFNKRIPKQKKIKAEKKEQTKKQEDFQGLSFNKA